MIESIVIFLIFILVTVYILQPLFLEKDIIIENTGNIRESFLQRKNLI